MPDDDDDDDYQSLKVILNEQDIVADCFVYSSTSCLMV